MYNKASLMQPHSQAVHENVQRMGRESDNLEGGKA